MLVGAHAMRMCTQCFCKNKIMRGTQNCCGGMTTVQKYWVSDVTYQIDSINWLDRCRHLPECNNTACGNRMQHILMEQAEPWRIAHDSMCLTANQCMYHKSHKCNSASTTTKMQQQTASLIVPSTWLSTAWTVVNRPVQYRIGQTQH